MKGRDLRRAFAVDHFLEVARDAFDNAVDKFTAGFGGGHGRFLILLIRPHVGADILRKGVKPERGFKFLRVAGQVLRQSMSALE